MTQTKKLEKFTDEAAYLFQMLLQENHITLTRPELKSMKDQIQNKSKCYFAGTETTHFLPFLCLDEEFTLEDSYAVDLVHDLDDIAEEKGVTLWSDEIYQENQKYVTQKDIFEDEIANILMFHNLGLSQNVYGCLRRKKIDTIEKLESLREQEILGIPGCGVKALEEILMAQKKIQRKRERDRIICEKKKELFDSEEMEFY